VQRARAARPLLGLQRRWRRELRSRDRHRLPHPLRLDGVDLHRRLALVARGGCRRRLAGLGAGRSTRALLGLPALGGAQQPARRFLRTALRHAGRAPRPPRTPPGHRRRADEPERRRALVYLSGRLLLRQRRSGVILGQVGLRSREAEPGWDPDARAGDRTERGNTRIPLSVGPARLLRRRDQRGLPGRRGLRAPGNALLDPVPRLPELGRRDGEPRLAEGALPGDATLRLRLRLPELHRSRPGWLETGLLRLEPSQALQIKRRYDPDNLFRFRQSIPAR
jgi:Berberine and berberine like